MTDLGLTLSEARVYTTLLNYPGARAAQLAEHGHIPRTRVYDILRSLEETGFCVTEGDASIASFWPVPTTEALPRLADRRQRQRDLEATRDRELVDQLLEELPTVSPPSSDEDMELLVGHVHSGAALPRLGQAAVRTLDIMQAPPFFQPREQWNVVEAQAVARGVRVRIINTPDAQRETERITQALTLGADVRVALELPMKLIVRDSQEAAFAPVRTASQDRGVMSVLVRQPDIVRTLQELFDQEWERAEAVNAR